MILTSSCQTDAYHLPLQESYQSIVLSLRFDWLLKLSSRWSGSSSRTVSCASIKKSQW